MWLIGRPAPDHKSITDFRKDGAAIRKVCTFEAANHRDHNFTRAKMANPAASFVIRLRR